jgi:predicted O-linked N-acetylglucosamine transferase (SPINDLY family)
MATISDALRIADEQLQAGRLELAIEILRRILAQEPGHVQANEQLALAYYAQAEACCRQGRLDAAESRYRQALLHNPNLAEAHNDLATVLCEQGRLDTAAEHFRQAVRLRPDYADAHYNLGLIHHARGDFAEAIACLRRTLGLQPGHVEAEHNLGAAWQALGHLDEAIACYQRVLQQRPADPKALNGLGTAWQAQGEPAAALDCYRQALQSAPQFVQAYQNLLCTLQYQEDVTPGQLREAHVEFDRRYAIPLRNGAPTPANPPGADRPLRLGFVSPDFGLHPVGYFLVRLLENLDPRQCVTVCYNDRALRDERTARLAAAATAWREVYGMADEQLAVQIRADGIDVLFDLAGHTQHNRLLVFARRPAPIQCTWMGYVGTTGLSAIDYLLADRYHVPPEAEPYYCERVLRMPDGYVCYDPPQAAPPVGPLPASQSGGVTFGSVNNPAKIAPGVIDAWSEILRRVPDSRLLLKYRGMPSPTIAGRLGKLFAERGVGPERLQLLDWSPPVETLACYGQIDVGLDTFPYSGGLTTCEALWMGVPVITWPGQTFASRHALSHLSNVGLTETIAGSRGEYVERAVRLAGDLPRLAGIRARLREQVAHSPLCDGPRFARHFAAMLRGAWRAWCQR